MVSLAIVHSRAVCGVQAPLVTVEAHLANGLPNFLIVGLPEAAVKESKDRVRSAISNSGFSFPARRITVNLGPADLPKEGGRYDLPIALGILAASGQIAPDSLKDKEFAGELALSGELRPVSGILPFAVQTRKQQQALFVAHHNAAEASLCGDMTIFAAHHLNEICAHLAGTHLLTPYQGTYKPIPQQYPIDLSEVHGQPHARRALEIAAAGGHSLLMIGPPGTGKTMLASRLATILPELTYEEALEVAAVASIGMHGFDYRQWRQRPFRAPHHTASTVALVGGGKPPRPGEISLAHHGVLFLDELPEFHRHVLEALREPLESGTIVISRAARQAEFPARFQLIAAMNPCPCGYLGDSSGRCHCSPERIQRYRTRLSGPLMDRIDMHIEVPQLPTEVLMQASDMPAGESSAVVRTRVQTARAQQWQRQGKINARLQGKLLAQHTRLLKTQQEFLLQAIHKLQLSARAYHRILRVARTIADLAQSENIESTHLAEALSYRRFTEVR